MGSKWTFLVPVTSDTVDSSSALLSIVKDRIPDVEVIALRSVDAPPIGDAYHCLDVADFSGPFEPRCLTPDDQIALAQPAALKHLLASRESVVWCGPGVLPVEPIDLRSEKPVVVASLSTVYPMHSLTPKLVSADTGYNRNVEPRLMFFNEDAVSFLRRWIEVCHQAMLDIDQRPIGEHSTRFVDYSSATDAIHVDGVNMLMSWIDYAAVKSDRAVGSVTTFVLADELFQMERELRSGDARPEVEWQMLVHRVHDSRPIEFLRDAIVSTPTVDLLEDRRIVRFTADARRAADPFGHRWSGKGSSDGFDRWLLETNQFGMSRAAELAIRESELWWEFPKARYQPAAFIEFVQDKGVDAIGFNPTTLNPQQIGVDGSAKASLANPVAWRWNVLKQLVPRSVSRNTARGLRAVVGADPRIKRGVAAPKRIAVQREPSQWGSAPRSLSLIGCFRSESGLGQAARASLQALQLMNQPFTYVDTSEKYPSRNSIETGLDWSTFGAMGDVNLIHSNADEMITMAGDAFRHRLGGRFNAAMWFWETADLPEGSRPAFDIVDELWVASEYLVDVFGQYAQVPVYNIGLAVDLPKSRDVDRRELGFRDDEFVFLFVYDALSSYGRKNPVKALEAFIDAFAPSFEGVRFVLKVSNLNKFPASQAEIRELEAKYPAITVIDEYLIRDGVLDLMAASDVYISLHAAEGYGLTILEAMALGTPSICTGYSGNMDFTTDSNSWLVDYEMISTTEPTGPYPKDSVWASPNVDSATDLMRHVANHRAEVSVKAKQARLDALEAASLEAYATRLGKRLRRVGI